jgi:hypothetical protein
MILNFKIDKKDRVLFLWCSSLRIDNKLDKRINNESKRVKEVDINKIKVRSPEDINLFKYNINGKPIKPHKDAVCLNCGEKIESYRLYEINFKTLIESHENRKRDNDLFDIYKKINMTSSGVEIIPYLEENNNEVLEKLKKYNYRNFIIPKVIMEIYPKMKYEDYNNLKDDAVFCAKTAVVCDSCYLDITRYCSMGGANDENILRTMKKGKIGFPLLREKKINKQFNSFNHSKKNNNIQKKIFHNRVSTAYIREYRNKKVNVNNNTYYDDKLFNLSGSIFSKNKNNQIKESFSADHHLRNTKKIIKNNNRPETGKIRKRNNNSNKLFYEPNKNNYGNVLSSLDSLISISNMRKSRSIFSSKDNILGNDYY